MKVLNVNTGQEAFALRWNLHAMSELVVGFPEGGMDSDYSSNWVCACHGVPLGEGEDGQVKCQWEAQVE